VARDNSNPDPSEDSRLPGQPGEFTRAFGGGGDTTQDDTALSPERSSSPPGSLTQILAGANKVPQVPPEKTPQSGQGVRNSSASPHANSFTTAFDGVNAFTRDLGDLREDPFRTEPRKQPRLDAASSAPSGTFTRIFGAEEGMLAPAHPEGDDFEKPSPRPQAPASRETSFSRGSDLSRSESDGFTDAFRAQNREDRTEPRLKPGSFTEQFPPSSWPAQEPPLPPEPPRAHTPMPTDRFRARQDEPPSFTSKQPPAPSRGGFTDLISSPGSEPAPLRDATRPISPPPRIPQRPIPDPSFKPPASSSPPGATVVFDPSRSEPEFSPPQGKSEYTMVVEASKVRAASDRLAASGAPSASAGSGAPPAPVQYPPTPQAPAWPPSPAMPPAPPWTPPQVPAPPMPQPPVVPQPSMPPAPPTIGERLVQFLPLILALSVINFLGLLAMLIIFLATRK